MTSNIPNEFADVSLSWMAGAAGNADSEADVAVVSEIFRLFDDELISQSTGYG